MLISKFPSTSQTFHFHFPSQGQESSYQLSFLIASTARTSNTSKVNAIFLLLNSVVDSDSSFESAYAFAENIR
jgi:hypothetical protein